jgi:hypothetical protein
MHRAKDKHNIHIKTSLLPAGRAKRGGRSRQDEGELIPSFNSPHPNPLPEGEGTRMAANA